MSSFRIPADKKIDPSKLDAWIHMNSVINANPSPGLPFIYVQDLDEGLPPGPVDPVALQELIDSATVRDGDPAEGRPYVYLDDLMMGFGGSRLEPDEVIRAAAMERLRQEEIRRQQRQ
ncbi:hypothetical protein [Pseudarthrobacter sp. BIM B-2242]|uniref:hypothetical protein n=1 Tax=Pseudarthrobacter sp. BIM B-2242 TaxID=2772401 RepID=UPI00168BC9BA|nr:hypothetical protein [Pseudarthrobacter sp. BIM B-2242]QOD05791.1 hypothetical protein IDT60_22425 [Pseudarthrobacter sp. BIM B-2242]